MRTGACSDITRGRLVVMSRGVCWDGCGAYIGGPAVPLMIFDFIQVNVSMKITFTVMLVRFSSWSPTSGVRGRERQRISPLALLGTATTGCHSRVFNNKSVSSLARSAGLELSRRRGSASDDPLDSDASRCGVQTRSRQRWISVTTSSSLAKLDVAVNHYKKQ